MTAAEFWIDVFKCCFAIDQAQYEHRNRALAPRKTEPELKQGNTHRLFYKLDQPEFTKRTGRHAAVLGSVEDSNDDLVSLKWSRKLDALPAEGFSEILVEGPLFDVMSIGGTDFAVTRPVMDLLVKCAKGDVDFLPVHLRTKKGKLTGDVYYALIFKRRLAAYDLAGSSYDKSRIATSPYSVLMVHAKGMSFGYPFIAADIVEEMISEGYTGLGFTNIFDNRKPTKKPLRPTDEEVERLPKTEPEKRIEKLREIATTAENPESGWLALLDYLAKEKKSKAWAKLQDAPVAQDAAAATEWLEDAVRLLQPPSNLKAYRFTAIESYTGDGYVIPKIRLAGSTKYTNDNRYSLEWAVHPEWATANGEFPSHVLDLLGEFSDEHENLEDTVSYTGVLGYCALLVRFALDGLSQEAMNAMDVDQRPVVVGFDDGDYMFLKG